MFTIENGDENDLPALMLLYMNTYNTPEDKVDTH